MADVFLATMEVDRQALDIQLVTLGPTELKCPYSGIKRKPDGLFLPRSFDSSTKLTWDVSKAYLEVYKSRSAATVEPIALGETTSAHSSTARSSTVVASKSSTGTRGTKPVASDSRSKAQSRSVNGHSSRSHASNNDPSRRSSRPKTAPSMSMQSIAEDEDEDDDNGNDSDGEYTGGSKVGSKRGGRSNAAPRRRVNTGVHNKVCQSPSYAIESLSTTPRRWVTGLLVQDSDMGVHYFDQCGGIVTYPFDFIKEPAKFALVLLAIGKASLTQVGYDPYFVCSGSTSLDNGLPSISNGQLLIPPSEDCDPESCLYTGASVPDSEWSRFIVAEKPLYVWIDCTASSWFSRI
ncbi:hypothetical protein ONZ45_g15147 [Pleurotus djamor]|nr:hypothetical protein ONZ45_g15147 [Pleurotus djamor]